jgi:hypothetical protein
MTLPKFPWIDNYISSICTIGDVKMQVTQDYAIFTSVYVSHVHGSVGRFTSRDEGKLACEAWYAHHLCCRAARDNAMPNALIALNLFKDEFARFQEFHARAAATTNNSQFPEDISETLQQYVAFQESVSARLQAYFVAARAVLDAVVEVTGDRK